MIGVMVMMVLLMEVLMVEVSVKITDQHKRMLVEAIDLKIASVKRARNTNKSPSFLELYDQELREYTSLQTLIVSAK